MPQQTDFHNQLSDTQVEHGLRAVIKDGIMSHLMSVFTGGVFLVGLALKLGTPERELPLHLWYLPFTLLAAAAMRRAAQRRDNRAEPTTNSTTSPIIVLTNAEGTCTARCILSAPTSKLPNNHEAGIRPRGCSPPKSAATMPEKP